MIKKKYKYIFVVLVYKNIDVLKDFFISLHVKNSHVIVVNSYYNDSSLDECKATALKYGADFIPIENKGFGYGNNIGTQYAIDHYEFDYLILSNSDILLEDISFLNTLDHSNPFLIAPYIHLKEGKTQNPNIPWNIKILIPLLRFAYTNNNRLALKFAHILTRSSRELFKLYYSIFKKSNYKIYSCHGSFIIFTSSAANCLNPIFNDKMFLYNEELYLAEKCRRNNVPILYCPNIKILHLEGASSTSHKGLGFNYNKQSFDVFYDWFQQNKNFQNTPERNR